MGWELRIKIFYCYEGSLKNPFFRGKRFTKNKNNREDCSKRRLGQLADLIGGLAKKM